MHSPEGQSHKTYSYPEFHKKVISLVTSTELPIDVRTAEAG